MEMEEAAKALVRQQLLLQQQAQQHHLSLYQQQQQQIPLFPSNQQPPRHPITPNPNPNPNPGESFLIQQQQQRREVGAPSAANQAEVQMAYQDAWRVCHPDFNRPFSSLEDACERLLPYHVVADYEAEEEDKILESNTTDQLLSRSQQWDNNIAAKVAEFTATFEKQARAYNMISQKRESGELRSEERLLFEKTLLLEEREALYKVKTEIAASRESQLRMAAAMIQGEQARGDPQAIRGLLRGSAVGLQGNEMNERQHGVFTPEEMMNVCGNNVQRDEREPLEDFLNDEEPDNVEASEQHEWRKVGLSLKSRSVPILQRRLTCG